MNSIRLPLLGTLFLVTASTVSAQTASGWKGTTSADFQTAGNWDNGFGSNFNLFIGTAWADPAKGNRLGSTTLTNAANYNGYRVTFENIASPVTFTLQGNNLNMFNFGSNPPQVNNSSTVSQQFNANIVFKTSSGSPSINATGGNLTFGATVGATTGKIFLNDASGAFQCNLGGTAGNTILFNTTVSKQDGTAGLRVAITGNEDVTFAGGVTGAGDILKQGSGTALFTTTAAPFGGGTNNFFIDQGTVAVATGSSLGTTNGTTTGLVNMGASGTAGLNSAVNINSSGLTIANPLNIRFLQTGGKTISGSFASASSTYSGTVTLADHVSLNAATGGTLIFSSAISQAAGTLSATPGAGNVNNSVPQAGNSFNTDGTKGPGLLINSTGTAGTVEFDAANTFTGDTVVQAGTLQFAVAGTSVSTMRLGNSSGLANATVNIADAHSVAGTVNVRTGSSGTKTLSATNAAASTATFSGHIALDDNATFLSTNAGATLAFTQAHGVDATTGFDIKNKIATFTGAGDFNLTGEVYESVAGGSVVKTGAGTLFLSNTNTYTGGTTMTGGIVKVNTTGGLGATSSPVTVNGATLEIAQAGTTTSNKSYFLGSNGGTVQTDNSVNLTLAGVVANSPSQSGSLTKTGPGTLTLGNANTYSGATFINAGTLALGASGSINSSSSIAIAAGGTFDISAISSFVLAQSLSASGTGIAGSAATIVGGTSVSFGSQNLALTFTPTSFSGDTTHPALVVSQGSLVLNNNTISINNAGSTALGPGSYRLIQVNSSSISGVPNSSFVVSGSGIATGTNAFLSVVGGQLSLEVRATAAFSNLTSNQTISYGTSSVTLSGKVSAAGPTYPADGESVFVTINGNLQIATISGGAGDFSINYNTSALPANATPYPITYSYGGSGTMSSASNNTHTLTVDKASQTITFNPIATKTYGDSGFDPGATASSGFAVSYSSSNPNVATVSGQTINIVGAGTSTITASQAGDSNHNAAPNEQQTLTVDPKSLTVTGLTGDNKPYDGNTGATFSGTPALNGVINSDDVSIAGTTTAAFEDKNVGTAKPVHVSGYTLAGTKKDNYALTQPTLSANITAKDLNVVAGDQTKAKGESDPTLSYDYDGLVSPDTISGALTRNPGESAGSYAITQGTLDAGSNYALHFTGATLVITGPIAAADSASRLTNSTAVSIPLASLIANDSRIVANGSSVTNNLSITSVTDGVGNHVEISGTDIVYRPNDPSASDSLTFTYTLSDGTSTDTGVVTVSTSGSPDALLYILSRTGPTYDSGTDTTTLTVNFKGVPNQSYVVEYKTNILDANWTPATANPVDTGATGLFQVILTASGDQTALWRKMYFRANE